MHDNRFDPRKLEKLNNPKRLFDIPVDTVWRKMGLPTGGTFVEIGAGTAFFSLAFLERGKAEKLYACDISEIMIDWMTENIVADHPVIIPIRTTEDTIPLANGIGDLVFMINLHHELDDPSLMMAESFRLTRPGGKVLVIDWKKKEMPEGPPLHIRCTPDEVAEQMAAAGFQEIVSNNELEKHFLVGGHRP